MKERLDKLWRKSKEDFDYSIVFDIPKDDYLTEFFDMIIKFMKEFDIGQHLSKNKWTNDKIARIKKFLYNSIDKHTFSKKKSNLELYEELRNKIPDASPYDIQRIVRTEGKRMSVIYSLLKMKKAGVTKARYVTRGDKKVSKICQAHAGKVYDIDYLLTKGTEHIPPLHPNCRCKFIPAL